MSRRSLGPKDLRIVLDQMTGRRFDPSCAVAVACRCPWGAPQVLLCHPLRKGWPFPTSFWLSCPWLIRAIGTIESNQGVSRLEKHLITRFREWRQYQMDHGSLRLMLLNRAERRFLRLHRRSVWSVLRSGGVGGVRYLRSKEPTVKCLHLQVASWLALGDHPGEDWLTQEVSPLSCPDGRCVC
ncbi:MAG: hypothetical protein CSA35_07075 [Dethiosulfovibrio peptidovorans]|nr:MAG: hypothetical protein CSA35_07075 [Dethiosulfovibrio peptidovorans]